MRRRRALLVPVLLGAIAACGATRVVGRDHTKRPILIGGAQPERASLERLKELYGIKTVVNLRGVCPDEGWFMREKDAVDAIGAKWVQLPTSGYLAPRPETVEAFFDLIEDEANWPIFVHCQMGVHRTGLMLALYRMQYEGGPGARALAEMRANGFDWTRVDRSAVEEYVLGYTPDPERTIER
jgi:protein tyrosine/serine phosphatase